MIVTARFKFDDPELADGFMRELDGMDYGDVGREIYVEGRE